MLFEKDHSNNNDIVEAVQTLNTSIVTSEYTALATSPRSLTQRLPMPADASSVYRPSSVLASCQLGLSADTQLFDHVTHYIIY